MNCPYCAETIKPEALVCRHCRRDLSFFKPIERRLRTVEEKLDVLVTETCQIMDSLQRIQSTQKTDGIVAGPVMKPSFSRVAVVVLIHIALTAACLGLYSAIQVAVRPSFEYDSSSLTSIEEIEQFNREYEIYLSRQRTILILYLPALFAIPIALGLWIGVRWQGRHFKRYLFIGVTSGAIEGVLFCVLVFITDRSIRLEGVYFLLAFLGIVLGINIARCTFGFISGGLTGDWIERKRSPRRHETGFAEKLARRYFGQELEPTGNAPVAYSTEARVKTLATAITATAPILALIGTIATSYIGYKTSTAVAAEQANAEKSKAEARLSSSPTPTPTPAGP